MQVSIPIYIINLKRNPERKLFISRQLNAFGLDYQFVDVDAIDKYKLKSKTYRAQIAELLDIDKSILENKYTAMLNYIKIHCKSKGAKYEKLKNDFMSSYSITLSHIKIYDLMAKNNIPAACILEDDATLLPTFPEVLRIAAAKHSWDILLLAHQPSRYDASSVSHKIKRIRIFNIDILLIGTYVKKQQKNKTHRQERLLKEYGFDSCLYPKQLEVIVEALREYDIKHAELMETLVKNNRSLSIVKHQQYEIYNELRKRLKIYTSTVLGALPEKSSLSAVTDHHCIASPRHKPLLTTAYLIKQRAATKWKQKALGENPLVIDEVPWELYKNEQTNLRLITPPCATATYNYLVHSVRRGL